MVNLCRLVRRWSRRCLAVILLPGALTYDFVALFAPHWLGQQSLWKAMLFSVLVWATLFGGWGFFDPDALTVQDPYYWADSAARMLPDTGNASGVRVDPDAYAPVVVYNAHVVLRLDFNSALKAFGQALTIMISSLVVMATRMALIVLSAPVTLTACLGLILAWVVLDG